MQATNVSQPIEYAVSLPSCRVNFVSRKKVNLSKGVGAGRILSKIWSVTIGLHFLRTQIKVIYLLLLTILEPASLILNFIHIDLNVLLQGVA